MIEAVTFDFWETLIHEAPRTMRDGQIQGWMEALEAEGIDRARDDVHEALTENWRVFDERWAANDGQHTAVDAVAVMCRHLGIEPGDALRDELALVFSRVGETVDLELAPGLEECLAALDEAGVSVGIVCDVGMTPSPTLAKPARAASACSTASRVGRSATRPAGSSRRPRRSRPALEALGVTDPTRAAHVGDRRRTDVAGARNLGMVSVRYAGWSDDPPESGPEADHVLLDHRDLPAALGL